MRHTTTAAALPPQLAETRVELEAASAAAAGLCSGLDERALAWRLAPKSWSIAERLRHLEVTTEVFLPGLDAAVARAQERRPYGDGPFELGRWGRILVASCARANYSQRSASIGSSSAARAAG